MSFEQVDFIPPIPAPPYKLPELVHGPNCADCVSIDVCPPIAGMQGQIADFNFDLVKILGTPAHDRAISGIFQYGIARAERQIARTQNAVDICPGGVELVHELASDDYGTFSVNPEPLVPTFGIQSIYQGLRPVESIEELEARGFSPALSETTGRVVRVGVANQALIDPNNLAFQHGHTVEGFNLLESFRANAVPPTEALPDNTANMIAEAVHAAVRDVLAQQALPTRRTKH